MIRDWLFRLQSLLSRRAVEQDLDDELRFHVERLVDWHVGRGMTRDEAVRRARLEFGGLDQIKEEHRDARGVRFADDLMRDIRYAGRQMARSPGFALLAVACLGLGIGVNTAIFGMVNAALLRPMPVDDAERLFTISRSTGRSLTYPAHLEFQARTQVLSGLAATFPTESDIDVDGESRFVASEVVSANYGHVLGVRPSLGRWFADDREPAAVISHAVWEQQFGLSPDAIGRVISSGAESYTIVGVAPREFAGVYGPLRTDLWVPLRTRPRLIASLENRSLFVMVFGRLREGASAQQAAAELNAIDSQLIGDTGAAAQRPAPIVVEPARGIPNPSNRRGARMLATLFAAVVAVVLLIACVNVGNLLLARGATRQREFAVRRALGASRARLAQQILIESLVLALGGAAAGVLLAIWMNRLLERSLPTVIGTFAMQLDVSLDWRAIAFATVASLVTTILCGLWPSWRASRAQSIVTFKSEIGGGRRRALGLVTQVVMSLVLLFVAGSFLQAVLKMQTTDPGFEVAHRLYAYTFLPSPPFTSERRRQFFEEGLDELRALPGLRAAALTSALPLTPSGSSCASRPGGASIPITNSAVDRGFFGVMGIELLAGRDFGAEDRSSVTGDAVVINETLAARLWPDAAAVGERLMLGCDKAQEAVVVGVARASAIRAVAEMPQPHVYRRFTPESAIGLVTVLMETRADADEMVQPVRRALLALGQGIRVYHVQPLKSHVERSYANVQWAASLVTIFGMLALLLAAIGLYGAIAYRVTLRTQEIGVRMALGARRADVFREVLRQGLAIVITGVAIGEVLTAALTGAVGSVLEGIGPTGITTHVAIAFIWIAVALAACYLPAARASRVDPVTALRHE